jgi:hypothetical protein
VNIKDDGKVDVSIEKNMVVGGIVDLELGGIYKGVVENVKGSKAWIKLENNRRRVEVS